MQAIFGNVPIQQMSHARFDQSGNERGFIIVDQGKDRTARGLNGITQARHAGQRRCVIQPPHVDERRPRKTAKVAALGALTPSRCDGLPSGARSERGQIVAMLRRQDEERQAVPIALQAIDRLILLLGLQGCDPIHPGQALLKDGLKPRTVAPSPSIA